MTTTEANTKQSNATQSETKQAPALTAGHYAALIRTIQKDLEGYEIEHDFTDDATGIHLTISYGKDGGE